MERTFTVGATAVRDRLARTLQRRQRAGGDRRRARLLGIDDARDRARSRYVRARCRAGWNASAAAASTRRRLRAHARRARERAARAARNDAAAADRRLRLRRRSRSRQARRDGRIAAEPGRRAIYRHVRQSAQRRSRRDRRRRSSQGSARRGGHSTGARAIRRAIDDARAGDVVVVAGKGHETYQIIGEERAAVRRSRRSAQRVLARSGEARTEAAERRRARGAGGDVVRTASRPATIAVVDRHAHDRAERNVSRVARRALRRARLRREAVARGAAMAVIVDDAAGTRRRQRRRSSCGDTLAAYLALARRARERVHRARDRDHRQHRQDDDQSAARSSCSRRGRATACSPHRPTRTTRSA